MPSRRRSVLSRKSRESIRVKRRRDNETPEERQRRLERAREYNYMQRHPECKVYRPHTASYADSFGELWWGLRPVEESKTEQTKAESPEQAIKLEFEVTSKPVVKVEPADILEPVNWIEPTVKSEPATSCHTTEAQDTDDGMESTFASVLVKTELQMDDVAADVDDEDTMDGVEDLEGPEYSSNRPEATSELLQERGSVYVPVEVQGRSSGPRYRLYQCPYCDYQSHSSGVNSHIGMHMNVREFRCHRCEFSTNYRTALHRHVRAHDNPPKAVVVKKRFRCQQCNFMTAYRHALKIHIGGRHSANKAFKCDVCEYCTRYATALRRHVLSQHSNPSEFDRGKNPTDHAEKKQKEYIKKFKCTHCDYITAHRHALKSHLGMHSDDKPFRCVLCQYCTKYSTALRRHRQTMHVDNQTSVFDSVASVGTTEASESETADSLISIEYNVSEDNDPLLINTKEIKIEIEEEQ